jgi:hypothetical protein
MPVILQRTAQSLADQADAGQPIGADTVARTLGTITGRVLRGPSGIRAVRAVDVFDRRWHRRARWAASRRPYPSPYGYRYRSTYPRRVRRYIRRPGYGRSGYVRRG